MSVIDVSVIVPVYDTGDLLLETIDSLLGQVGREDAPVPSFEVVVIDDQSSDLRTREILDSLTTPDQRIRVLANVHKKGVSGARNTGIEAARGKWIAFCDSDDLWLPNALSDRWAVIQANPEIKWLVTPYFLMRNGQIERTPLSQRSPCLYGLISESYDQGSIAKLKQPVAALLRCGCPGPLASMATKALIDGRGGFDESMHRAEDYLLWLRMAAVSDLFVLPTDTAVYRLRAGSITRSGAPMFELEDEMVKILRRDPEFDPFARELSERMALVLTDYCYHSRKKGEWSKARSAALRLLWERPLQVRSWKHCLAAFLRVG